MNAHAVIIEPNPRAAIGANNPPADEPNPFEACKVHMDDLLTEARNWADGVKVETQAQADDISRLIEDLRLAEVAAEGVRVAEKKPLDDQVAEIQARFNVYIAPLKNKVPGKIPLAVDALKSTLKPFLDAEKARKDAIAEAARAEAQRLADEAAAAMRAATPDNLEAREAAEELIEGARLAAKDAARAENDKAQARGGSRALGLKTYLRAEMTDALAALNHYGATNPDAIKACLQALADADARAGRRTIPGFIVHEETRL